MHLKSYPKFVHSELHLDAVGSQTGGQRRTSGGGRLPLSVISTNALHCSDVTNNNGSSATLLQLLQPFPPLPGHEDDTLRLYQTTSEDSDATLDIWNVIKPGHVREKIAIFASDGDGIRTSSSSSPDRTLTLPRAVKAKGSWEENSGAKRRRRSDINQNHQQDQRIELSLRCLDRSQRSGDGQCGNETETVDEEQKVSVVEMVAFLEQRVSEQQLDTKPLLAPQRSSTTITLSRALTTVVRGEEPENIRVSDMVAKLESKCLRRRTEGDLSRSNSLRRTVGRVLLAAVDHVAASSQSSAPSTVTSSLLQQGVCATNSESPSCSLTVPPSPDQSRPQLPRSGESAISCQEIQAPPPQLEETEPLPGLLFLSPASEIPPLTDSEPQAPAESGSQLEWRSADRGKDTGHRASASQDFLLMRQRLQQLLEPQPFLAVLPHHLLLKIFLLLPTQSLAALKCTCHYFRFIINTYDVRPADSLWVSDPRYRDDPCKQCKKRYGRGDVSLCRWHHKPFCQALPYGPGYWMCCHGARRDAPGCNVGLHDNRWVPAFHSINVPMYRWGQHN